MMIHNSQAGSAEHRHDIFVIGASAGGIEPLLTLIGKLPSDLAASIFVVVHIPAHSGSRLPEILSRAGALPARHAKDGEAIVPGRIYVAPPDRHLLVRRGSVEVSRGPRENHSRPAIDPLFRSAARAYGPRAVGVILSGALYDGAAGLLAIKERGGVAIVQDAEEATIPSMPLRALNVVDVDSVLSAAGIGDALARYAQADAPHEGDETMMDDEGHLKEVIANDFAQQARNKRTDEPTMYTCPDCGGVLWQTEQGPGTWFQCHVGHGYAPEVLLGLKSEELESALWSCMRLLREKATLTRQSAIRHQRAGSENLAERVDEQAQTAERQAEVLRELLEAMPGLVDLPEILSTAGEAD